MYSWILILYFGLESNTILLCCSNYSIFGHCELFQSGHCVLLIHSPFPPPPLFVALLCFLALQDAPGSSYIFSRAPALESAISPRSPGPFYWRVVLEIKIWALRCLFLKK